MKNKSLSGLFGSWSGKIDKDIIAVRTFVRKESQSTACMVYKRDIRNRC